MLSDPVVHLDMVIPPFIGDHSVVGAGAQFSQQLWGEGDGVVIEAVEVNDKTGPICVKQKNERKFALSINCCQA